MRYIVSIELRPVSQTGLSEPLMQFIAENTDTYDKAVRAWDDLCKFVERKDDDRVREIE